MLRGEPYDRSPRPGERVSDAELGIAAILVGVLVLLTTFLVPLIG